MTRSSKVWFMSGLGIAAVMWGVCNPCLAGDWGSSHQLKAVWNAAGVLQELKSWTLGELSQLKHVSSREKDPVTGRLVKWEGVLLSHLIDQVLEKLPIENRAQVDLIVLRNSSGEVASMPRSLVSKYPVMLATPASGKGEIYSVIPWSSKPKILSEDLPLENFFIPQVIQIELANYRDRYSSLFLKRRTDPSAMRGEKLFVQNCVNCHRVNQSPALGGVTDEQKARKFAQDGHPPMKISLKLSQRDRASIVRYLDAHRTENPGPATRGLRSAQAQSSLQSNSTQ